MHSLKRQSTDKHSETDKGKMRLNTLINLSVNICFWMHTVGTANANTVSPPWITLSGCYNYSSSNSTSNIQNNEPTQCFEKCPNSQSVGLKNMSCICNPLDTFDDIQINGHCNLSCPGKSVVYCGREGAGNDLMSVYTRGGINLNTSYGYGYVEISGVNKIIHASDNTSLQYWYLCYDDFRSPGPGRCRPWKSTVSTWEKAIKGCNGISARLITASEISICSAGSAFDGTYWIGVYREKPDFTTSTTVTSTSTTATSTSSSSSKPKLSFKTTTGSRPNHNSDTPVIEQTSKASSSDGINVVTVAAPVAVIFVAMLVVLASILICKKRKLLCFKERHKSGEMDQGNNASPLKIPELIATMASSSVPPGSTRAPFQSQYPNGRPTTARITDIQGGQYHQTVLNSEMFYTNIGGKTQNFLGDSSVRSELSHNEMEDKMQSDMNVWEKRKKKRERKLAKKHRHRGSVDKEYENIEANTPQNNDNFDSHTNDDLSAVNGRTGHPNDDVQDNETRKKKKKTKHTKEYSYPDDETNNTSAEPGSGFVSEHHSKRRIATASLVKVKVTGNLPDEQNDKVNDNQGETLGHHEILRETQIETTTNEYEGLFDAPAEAPIIEEQTDLNIERLRRKHKKRRREDDKNGNEDKAEQEGLYLNEVHKEPIGSNTDARKEKKKKRKRSRERLKENVLNGYDEIGDAPAAKSVLEEQSDLENEGSKKKHKKRKRKKDKKRDNGNAAEQLGLDLENDAQNF